ncbi:CarD family transcriptional regulator [Buchnera aphidicola (Kurisakia onigurumii)]|uniref:DEAD/DEAH box helicase n=1 Tax=Buchnera aphidicola TaxID=9 RepID=UPI0031B6FE4B
MTKIKINNLFIHIEHGIGRYKGLKNIKINNIKNEYLILEYANKAKLYVPIYYLYLIKKYSHPNSSNITLSDLGSKKWNIEKNKIVKKIFDSAAKLLQIYAHRKSSKGFSFINNIEKYQKFILKCPFETTKDQKKAINSVFHDMYKPIPMDRVICGDVGLGKTEVAIHASFLSIINKKQVSILVPTTLLAQQHFHNFKERFNQFNVNIQCLTRLEKKENIILKNLRNGKINILIGTHKILLKKIIWKNIGLLIIDEEHRFGVFQKEYIKKIYPQIDILTLTATPLPRTLNMVIHGIRNITMINTPPKKRLPVKTFVQEYDLLLIKKIIKKELRRGGQVYYVFNDILKIKNVMTKLLKIIPNLNIRIGHSKLSPRKLKIIMQDFYNKKFDVLLCTTIIETGIDIPNVNSIIVENSHMFGLSQLHQLRGRVGRSNLQGYAWFLVHNLKNINEKSKIRLSILASIKNTSGIGILLSQYDLEMRGVGEILGKEQSGFINNIGIHFYSELLKKSIQILKNKNNLNKKDIFKKIPEIELNISSIFPSTYIENPCTRIKFYRKLSLVTKLKKLQKIEKKIIKKFGIFPEETKNLILITKIRIMSYYIGIKKIHSNDKKLTLFFLKKNNLNFTNLLNFIKKNVKIWKINKDNIIELNYSSKNQYDKKKFILNLVTNSFHNRLNQEKLINN